MSDAPAAASKGKKGKAAAAAASAAAAATAAAVPAAAAAADEHHATSTAASSDALMDLLASKIDFLEGSQPLATDESALTSAELSSVSARFAELRASLDSEAEAGKAPAEQIAMLLDLYRSEVQSRTVTARQLADAREKLTRAGNQKRHLENLCKELQERNKKMSAELKTLSVEQSRNHQEMKAKFETNLGQLMQPTRC
jgi:chromosome segregation ATPase